MSNKSIVNIVFYSSISFLTALVSLTLFYGAKILMALM